jgi:hypothetical protein
MQLIAGATGRAYNRRKERRGAFWEECYHATAVDSEEYLARCLVYIDLNMVRAGAIRHPREWAEWISAPSWRRSKKIHATLGAKLPGVRVAVAVDVGVAFEIVLDQGRFREDGLRRVLAGDVAGPRCRIPDGQPSDQTSEGIANPTITPDDDKHHIHRVAL